MAFVTACRNMTRTAHANRMPSSLRNSRASHVVAYTKWQMVPQPAWCNVADNKERCERLAAQYEDLTIDIFASDDKAMNVEKTDEADMGYHTDSQPFKCEELGVDVVFKCKGKGPNPVDDMSKMWVENVGSKAAVKCNDKTVGQGEKADIPPGAVLTFDDVPFQVLRNQLTHA